MKRRAITGRQALLWIVSLLVAASMICSFITYLRPPRSAPKPSPTPIDVLSIETVTPPSPTIAPSPTPANAQPNTAAAPGMASPSETPAP